MSFNQSAGVYVREINQSSIATGFGVGAGAIVVQANQGKSNEPVLITNNKQFVETFGEPVNGSMLSALAFLNNANRLYVVRKTFDATAAVFSVLDSSTATTFTINAIGEGLYGNDISFTIDATNDVDVFLLSVFYKNELQEEFKISKIQNKVDGYGRSVYLEDAVNDKSAFITVADTTSNTNAPDTATYGTKTALTGGSDDTATVAVNDVIAGYDLFVVKDELKVSYLINAGWADASIKTRLVTIAEGRKDCIAVLDSTYGDTVTNMVTEAGTFNSDYAAFYAPWLKDYDQYHDKYIFVPPSGYVAGVYAKTASEAEVWYAPAGSNRGVLNVVGVEKVFTEGERDTLYQGKVNPIQQFYGEGVQIVGQKTLTNEDSALSRVNVRMLMIELNNSFEKTLKPFVHEINDNFVRDNITTIANNYLETIKANRGIYDYKVVCDTSNNTPTVIDNNQLIVDIFVKPTRVAEFIRVNAVITATGVSLN